MAWRGMPGITTTHLLGSQDAYPRLRFGYYGQVLALYCACTERGARSGGPHCGLHAPRVLLPARPVLALCGSTSYHPSSRPWWNCPVVVHGSERLRAIHNPPFYQPCVLAVTRVQSGGFVKVQVNIMTKVGVFPREAEGKHSDIAIPRQRA